MAIVFIHGLYIFLIILPIISSSSPDSEALLRLKASFTNATSLISWRPGTEPCANGQWVGVMCENGVVSGLRLTNLGLTGRIDGDALAAISGLRIAAFMLNAFSGPIPNIHATTALRGLYLTGNQFSDPIPADFFVGKEVLKRVWLSDNNFSGPIPASLARLPGLEELHLENNRFSGLIPPFDQQSLVSVNFSNNNLEGEIPLGLARFGTDPFQGNAGLKRRKHRTSEEHNLVVAFFFLMACVALLLVMVVVVFLMRRRSRGTEGVDDEQSVKHNLETPLTSGKKLVGGSSKIMNVFGSSVYGRRAKEGDDLVFMNEEKGSFGMADMMRAGAKVMRNGALGSSFKTTLAGGMAVVVKRVREFNKIGRVEFDEKIRLLGSLRHKNVLPPFAFYNGKDEKLLVFEYQQKGNLLLLLHDDQESSPTELDWPMRLKIIQGIANGLDFLHTELSSLELPHGDLKSSNVLLSVDYEPLLADYGFWSLIGQSPTARSLIAFKVPEVAESSCISPKCDVYFLGVMILEILARKFPSQYLSNSQGGIDLVVWARSAVAEGREGEMLDPDVANAGDSVQQMKQLVHIASCCTEDDPDRRLGLKEVVRRIESLSVVGDDEIRRYEVVPSLRDGIVHPAAAEYSNGGRRHSSGDQSGRKSFTFETIP